MTEMSPSFYGQFCIIIVIILFESGNMAYTETQKDIQTDKKAKKVKVIKMQTDSHITDRYYAY